MTEQIKQMKKGQYDKYIRESNNPNNNWKKQRNYMKMASKVYDELNKK